jgi:hypothetical protein
MVGKRDQTHQAKNIFNLISLRLESLFGSQGRRPIGGGQVNRDARSLVLAFETPAQYGPSLSELLDKSETLFGAIGVTMK